MFFSLCGSFLSLVNYEAVRVEAKVQIPIKHLYWNCALNFVAPASDCCLLTSDLTMFPVLTPVNSVRNSKGEQHNYLFTLSTQGVWPL